MNARRESIYVALVAAELCWVVPLFLALGQAGTGHVPILTWVGMLVVVLAFFYAYRALEAALLPLPVQQGLLVLILVLSAGLFLHFHVYAGRDLPGLAWVVAMFRDLASAEAVDPSGWLALMFLVYMWARAIRLARRSLSTASVGLSFRLGVVLLMLEALFLGLAVDVDLSGWIVPYFFFALTAVALARVEEVGDAPNSSRVASGAFWIGSSLAAVVLLLMAGGLVALFFSGGGLQQLLTWLWPVVNLVWIAIAAIGAFLLILFEALLSLLSIDLESLGQGFMEALRRLGEFLSMPPRVPAPGANPAERPGILGFAQVATAVAIPLLIVAAVLVATWVRRRLAGQAEGRESRESTLSPGAAGRGLRAMLQAGLDRLGELAGLVDRFGLGSRFLAAVSIRRIYANLVRLATQAGYPRARSETPYEYLSSLRRALPGSEAAVEAITEAYVNAHYGQVPDSREELERIRHHWEQIRARS